VLEIVINNDNHINRKHGSDDYGKRVIKIKKIKSRHCCVVWATGASVFELKRLPFEQNVGQKKTNFLMPINTQNE